MLQRHPFDMFKSQSIPCRCGFVPSKGYRSLGRERWSMEASARTSMCVTKEDPSGAIASEPPNIALYAASYPPRALLSPPTLTRVCACDARRQRHVVGRMTCWAQQGVQFKRAQCCDVTAARRARAHASWTPHNFRHRTRPSTHFLSDDVSVFSAPGSGRRRSP